MNCFHPSGELVPTPEEAAAIAQVEAQQAQTRADRLAEQLKALGVEPEA